MLTFIYDAQEKMAETVPAVMVNGNTALTIAGGPILLMDLVSFCVTANDTTASTLQWQIVPTGGGSTVTFTGASTSLALAATGAGAFVRLAPTALTTALVITINTTAVALGTNLNNHILLPAGAIKMVIGVGSTTGTWKHYLRYQPLGSGITVS
jgi:lysylphosphatidylglycerol synthetase-like protein (DUF2156 family)